VGGQADRLRDRERQREGKRDRETQRQRERADNKNPDQTAGLAQLVNNKNETVNCHVTGENISYFGHSVEKSLMHLKGLNEAVKAKKWYFKLLPIKQFFESFIVKLAFN
jgi:hypothetical protein